MIRLSTLGSVRVYRDTSEVPDLPAQRLRFALLLYLASERDVSRDEVVALFWPERATSRGKHALRQMLYELRNALGEDWLELRRDRILCTVDSDAADFESAATAGRRSDALRVYTGPFLAGFALDNVAFEGWVDRRRAHLSRLHRRLQREEIAELVEQGRLDDALVSARRWVELDPLDDEAAHTLIERLALSGQRTAALQYYESYEKQLAAELQVEPLDETRELVAGIRSGEQHGALTLGSVPTRPQRDAAVLHGAPVRPAPDTHRPARPGSGPWVRRLIRNPLARRVAVALLIIAATVSVALVAYPREYRPGPISRTVRIAVLPLHDHTADASLRGIANELTEQLTASLAQSHVIEVVSFREVELESGGRLSPDSVARLSGADYVVGGSMQKDGDLLRLSLALTDGRHGGVVRSRSMERTWNQAQNLVDDIVASAAMFLRTELGTELEIQRVRAAGANNSWQVVLDGKELVNQSVTLVRARQYDAAMRALDRADSTFEVAQRFDPKWAEPLVQRAWVRHRRAYLLRHFLNGESTAIVSCMNDALGLADRALALNADDVGAHEVRGVLLKTMASDLPADSADRLLRGSEQALQRAVHLEPQRQTALRHLAELLLAAERYGEARIAAAEAHRADPYANTNIMLNLLWQASFEAFEDELADGWCMQGRFRFRDQAPFTWCLLAMHAWGITPAEPAKLRRELANASPMMFRAQPELADKFDAMLASAFARAGEPDSARAILRRLEQKHVPDLEWLRAAAHVQLGEDSAALALLRSQPLTRAHLRVMRQRAFWRLRDNADFQRLIHSGPI